MKKSLSHLFCAGALAAMAALPVGAPAYAAACRNYQPGMLAFIAGTRPAPACASQGDYMVNQAAAYDGPAMIAPQPTYAPTRTAADYPYVHGQYRAEPAVRAKPVVRATVTRVKRTVAKKPVVNVKNDLPPGKGRVQIVHASAEVRIYGPERMDIRLYRR
jgi:hypothetical protein